MATELALWLKQLLPIGRKSIETGKAWLVYVLEKAEKNICRMSRMKNIQRNS